MKLSISHLSKQYRRDFWGLRDFDLDLAPALSACSVRMGRGNPP